MSDIKVEYHKKLNQKLWDGDELKPEVRKKLLSVTNCFLDFCGVYVSYKDILLVGSQANYTWTPQSDIDIDVLVNFDQFRGKSKDFMINFFETKKKLFKRDHDIRIFGIPMEVTISDKNGSDGEYSLVDNKWITQPEYKIPDYDEEKAKKLHDKWKHRILKLVRSPDKTYRKLIDLKSRLKDKRTDAVEKGDSEFHPMNLAYKSLRKKGYVDLLKSTLKKELVKHHSLKNSHST